MGGLERNMYAECNSPRDLRTELSKMDASGGVEVCGSGDGESRGGHDLAARLEEQLSRSIECRKLGTEGSDQLKAVTWTSGKNVFVVEVDCWFHCRPSLPN